MSKKIKVLISISVCIGLYFIGPQPSKPKFDKSLPEIPEIYQLESFIAKQESLHKLKPNNQARIVWMNDTIKSKTEYAIVYLHGFSASQEEGNPVHRNIAKKFGCNLQSRQAERGQVAGRRKFRDISRRIRGYFRPFGLRQINSSLFHRRPAKADSWLNHR